MKHILLFSILAGFLLSCSKEYVSQNDITIDGQTRSYDLVLVDSRNEGEGTDTNMCIYSCSFVESGLPITSGFPKFGLTFGTNRFLKGDDENFDKLISPGPIGFLTNSYTNKGIAISCQAGSTSPVYSTLAGEQDSGALTIEHVKFTEGNPDRTNFSLSFSCRIYNETNPTEFKNISGTVYACFYPHF